VADVVSEDTGPAHSAGKPEDSPFVRRPTKDIVVNQRRFGFAYLVLAIGVGVAVGLAIVLIGRGSSHHAPAAVQGFKATQPGELGAKEIARHVGVRYRLGNGQPLVGIIGERPNYQNAQLFNYLIRPHDAQDPRKDIAIFPVDNGIMYTMCAFAPTSCSVPQNRATSELLKREALELAFDTFKSDSAVDTVTTLLPPAQQAGVAVIFRRDQLAGVLGQPLSKLLPESGPVKPSSIGDSEQQRIDLLVAPALYAYDTQFGPDGNPLLRLDPLG
jgi:hypothetical protein